VGWIFARRDPNVSEGVGLQINNEGFVTTQLQTAVLSQIASAVPVIEFNGEWQHVAVTVDTSTGEIRLYLNGKPLPLGTFFPGSFPPSGQFANVSHLFIGQRENFPGDPAGNSHYKGLIDEVEFYNRALRATEIQAIFSVGGA
jgi:concanavalin A-like lectin/glucanase superfamily protein